MPNAKLFYHYYYNYSDLELKVLKKKLTKKLKYNKIRPSKLPHTSTILIVKKPHANLKNLRLYINYYIIVTMEYVT